MEVSNQENSGKVGQGQMVKGLECQAKDFGIYPGGSRKSFKFFSSRVT